MTKEEIQSKIIKLEFEIDVLERRLDNGMSNQMKIRWYKRDIRNKQKEIAKLKKTIVMSRFKLNQSYELQNGTIVTIEEVIKGDPTNKPNYQSGVLHTGFKGSPRMYRLSNGKILTGAMLLLSLKL